MPCTTCHPIKWGHGRATLVEPSTTEETERVAFVPDLHFPYQEPALIESALRFLRHFKPHRVVLLGDVLDFHAISRWNAAKERLDDLQEEIDEAAGFLVRLRKAAPGAHIDWTEGNHDERLAKYVATEARALKSLRVLELPVLLDLAGNGITYHSGAGFLLRPGFLVKHGTFVRKGAGASAKAEALAAGVSGISGHTHRLAPWRQTGYNKLQWNEAGTLSRLDAPYVQGVPDWAQGMCVGYFGRKSWRVEEVYVEDGKLVYGGRSF